MFKTTFEIVLAMTPRPKRGPKKNEQPKSGMNVLIAAVKACVLDNKPVRTIAKDFGLPRTTLQRHVKSVQTAFPDISTVSQDDLVEYVKTNTMRLPENMVFKFVLLYRFFRNWCEYIDGILIHFIFIPGFYTKPRKRFGGLHFKMYESLFWLKHQRAEDVGLSIGEQVECEVSKQLGCQ